MDTVTTFDYIVVGGGSAGSVVAGRLSEGGKRSVALLEAGGEPDSFWFRVPIGYGKLYNDPRYRRYNWSYESEPEPGLDGARSYQPRGKVLGGTGAINGLDYVRGQREDFDLWRQLGNVGWGYEDVLPYFRKSEDNEAGANLYHGTGGPFPVSNMPPHRLAEAFFEAASQAGYPRNPDFNGELQEGFGYNQVNTRRGRRWTTADAYLAERRSNLCIILNALATRIVVRDGRVAGVEYEKGGSCQTVLARSEVILCLGAFNSPQLLQLSGVGPGDLLKANGIPVVVERREVGANLQDHFGTAMNYRCTQPITLNDRLKSPLRRAAMGLKYLLFRKGMMATNGNFGSGYIRTDPAYVVPNIKLRLRLWSRQTVPAQQGSRVDPFSGFSVSLALIHPESRGSVTIGSADPRAAPRIRFNFFTEERDRRDLAKSVHLLRGIMSKPAMAPYIAAELSPGHECDHDEAIVAYCRRHGHSGFHAAGSCRMGADDGAVVDPRLRVRGVSGLRVADASIMPTIVGANTNAATVMIGEKAAAMILEDS